jgi:GAF domain-containing protein
VALEGKPIHNPDVLADPNYQASEYQRLGDYRSMLGIPLLREGAPIGVFILTRQQVRPFTDRQIELVTGFADQAVIAIENVRLFDEVEARTRLLAASLDDLRAAQDRLVQTENPPRRFHRLTIANLLQCLSLLLAPLRLADRLNGPALCRHRTIEHLRTCRTK